MRKIFFLIAAILLVPKLSSSQTLWSLENCINKALESNIQIKQQQLNSTLAKLQYNQSIASFFPSINGSANHVYNNGQMIDPVTNEFADALVQSNNFGISANLIVFNGLQQLNTFKQKQFDFLASKYDVEKIKNDISLTIAVSYLQILYNKELLIIANKQVENSKAQVERTKQLFQAGTVAKGNLLSMEAQLASDEVLQINAQNQLEISYLTLAQLMDIDVQGFEIATPAVMIPEAGSILQTLEDIYGKALDVEPEIRSAELKVKSARKGVSIAYGYLSPSLSLSGSLGTGYSESSNSVVATPVGEAVIGRTESGELVYAPVMNYQYNKIKFSDQIDKNLYNSIGLYLNVPIFNKWQVQTGISSSKIGLRNAELVLENSKKQLLKSIQQAYADAKAAINKYNAANKSVAALNESLGYMQIKLDEGLITTLDYNNAKNNLLKAMSEALQAKYDFIFRLKVLDFYQGKPLTL